MSFIASASFPTAPSSVQLAKWGKQEEKKVYKKRQT